MRDDRAADQSLEDELEAVREQFGRLTDRVADLEAETDQLEAGTDRLESENERLRNRVATLESRLEEDVATVTSDLERVESKADAAINRSGTNRDRVAELQARELEKGAHLRAAHVDRHELDLEADHLEKITADDGDHYYRLPDHEDPLERGGSVALAHADLLPIQQLARMDEPMLQSTTSTLPSKLAAQLWKARVDSSVGDDPWQTGGKGIRAYVKASDLKHWIRRREPGTSEAYAKKLVSRTIDALLELSKNRVAVRKQTERKNGLRYKERRIVLPTDADIPGGGLKERSGTDDVDAPATADVHG